MTDSLQFNPPVIAHRGASGYAPENTLSAFTKAVQLGCRWIEFDVVLAACGEPVVFHDETLERTSNGKGMIETFPYSFLRTLDAGAWFNPVFSGEVIPTLQQTIFFLQQYNMHANLEIKAFPGQEERVVKQILNELPTDYLSAQSPILFSSFSIEVLHILRKLAPDCLIGLLLHEWLEGWESIYAKLKCVSVHINDEILQKEAALQIKNHHQLLLVYTVNNPQRAEELFAWGVDAVFTDYPDRMLNLV